MFERVFQWTMKRGSRILFWPSFPYLLLAILQFALWLLQTIAEGRPSVAIQLGLSLIGASWTYTLSTAGLLLFGALVIDRLDRKLAHSD
jgi:hypothetical protein